PATRARRRRENDVEIKWTDADPETGQRRYIKAERFAGTWRFRWKYSRRGPADGELTPTLETWETVLDALKRRYRRREGVSDEDVAQVEKVVAELRRREERLRDEESV